MVELLGPNPFKLGLFCYNVEGGVALTTVPERWPAGWDDIVAAVQMAEHYGLEFALPVARWRGYGEENLRGASFETMTQAAALAGQTEAITLFATVHVPLVHPLLAAKCMATVDHASHGRAALNVVAGWNQEEFDMFGHVQPSHLDRYAQAREWCTLFNRLIAGGTPFDHAGEYYQGRGMVVSPGARAGSLLTLNAAVSDSGRAFAAEFSDYIFTLVGTLAQVEREREAVAAAAERVGRRTGMLTTCYVVCRPTRHEAEAYLAHYAGTMADTALLDRTMKSKGQQIGHYIDDADTARLRLRYAAGNGSHPLVGTPMDVAEQLIELSRMGFAGTALSFVNFTDELPFFSESVLPILRAAGLRL